MTRLALWLFDLIAIADLLQVYRELRESLLGEMDYRARGARRPRRSRATSRAIPSSRRTCACRAIHWDLTTAPRARDGVHRGREDQRRARRVAALGARLPELVRWIARAFLHMMFRDGFFHCDPHPGNLMLTPDGRIGIVDFGMHRRIAPEVLAAVRENLLASVRRDRGPLRGLAASKPGMIDARDMPGRRRSSRELGFDPALLQPHAAGDVQLDFGEYFGRMRGQLKRIRSFRLPDGLVMWSRAISLLYGLLVELAPGVRPLDVLGPFVAEFLQGGAPAALEYRRFAPVESRVVSRVAGPRPARRRSGFDPTGPSRGPSRCRRERCTGFEASESSVSPWRLPSRV